MVLGGVMMGLNGNAMADDLPEIYIKAVNPGYTIDGTQNVGEMIEIGRKNSDTPTSLAGMTLSYTTPVETPRF